MPLQKQVFSVPFMKGRETKLDPAVVDNNTLLKLENAFFSKQGTPVRREAWQALVLGTSSELAALGPQLLSVDNTPTLSTFSETETALVSVGPVPNSTIRKDSISRPTQNLVGALDSASTLGLTLFSWIETTTGAVNVLRYCIVDEATDAIIFPATSLPAAALGVRCVAVGNMIAIVYGIGSDAHVYTIFINMTGTVGSVFSGPTAAVADYNQNVFDACAIGSDVALLYASTNASDATATVRLVLINNTGAVDSGPTTILSTGTLLRTRVGNSLGIAAFSAAKLGLIISNNSTTSAYTATVAVSGTTIGAVTGPTSVAQLFTPLVVALCLNSGGSMQCYSGDNGLTNSFTQITTFTLSGTNTAGSRTAVCGVTAATGAGQEGPYVYGKPFLSGTAVYLPVAIYGVQATLFLVDTAGNVVARCMTGSLAQPGGASVGPPLTSAISSGSFSIPVLEQGSLQITNGLVTTEVGISRLLLFVGRTNIPKQPYNMTPLFHAQAADEMYFSGANPSFYDGVQVAEAGFQWFPQLAQNQSAALAGAGSGTLSNGVYQVCALYEWVDGRGRRHQSAPSNAVTFTVADHTTNGQATYICGTLQLGVRAPGATVVFFRTQANGSTFYRVNSPLVSDSPAPLPNSTTASTVTMTDQTPDATIAGNEVLYTQGGTLPNDAPPSCRAIATAPDGRLCIAGLENPYEIRFSQAPINGVGLQWNEQLAFIIRQDLGEPQALAFQDGNWIVFTPTRKLLLPGVFPAQNGQNGPTYVAQPLPGDVGCIDQRSVAVLPNGVAFQSRHGYYLLTRALTEAYNDFGAPVEADILGGTAITSAVVLEDKSQLRLVVTTGGTNFILAYDILYGQWSKLTTVTATNPFAACVWQGSYVFSDVSVLAQICFGNNGAYLDLGAAGNTIVTTHRTAWIKLSALNGFGRVWRCLIQGAYGATGADSSLAITVDFDNVFGGPNSYTVVFPSTLSLGPIGGGLPPLRHLLQRQKCQTVAFTIVDTPVGTAAAGAGVNLSGLTFELGMKKGGVKPVASGTQI